jgi:hypothetical protein
VLSFTQFMGSPEAKSRGRSLVGDARWTLTRDSLTCAPADAMPGYFPMTVKAVRDGDRVSFEGMRAAKAGEGYAYVRISGNVAPARKPPLMIVDLEFGRVSGPDGADPQPTFKSQARLELRPE